MNKNVLALLNELKNEKSGDRMHLDYFGVQWWIGKDANNHNLRMVILSDNEIPIFESLKIIAISSGTIAQRHAMSFDLQEKGLEDVFITLCLDIIESARKGNSLNDSFGRATKRYKQWVKLLRKSKKTYLNVNEIKGLIGELLFIRDNLDSKGNEYLIKGWDGPTKGDKDFVFPDHWVEVKTISASASSLSISSFEQLQSQFLGTLQVYKVEKGTEDGKAAFSLNEVIREIRDKINDIDTTDLFDEKLLEYGHTFIDEEYEKRIFYLHDSMKFKVDESFPKITREEVDSKIVNLQYQIDLIALNEWRI